MGRYLFSIKTVRSVVNLWIIIVDGNQGLLIVTRHIKSHTVTKKTECKATKKDFISRLNHIQHFISRVKVNERKIRTTSDLALEMSWYRLLTEFYFYD